MLDLAKSNEFGLQAFSFLESRAKVAKPLLIENLRLAKVYEEWPNAQQENQVWATFTFPLKEPCSMSLSQAIYTITLAEIVGAYWYNAKKRFTDEGNGKPTYLNLCIDKLSGDTADAHWRAHVLKEIASVISDGWIGLSMNRDSDSAAGDLLADNMCGWLNSGLEDTQSLASDAAKRLGAFHEVFNWYELGATLRWTNAVERLLSERPISGKTARKLRVQS